jgi:hypothetical protein
VVAKRGEKLRLGTTGRLVVINGNLWSSFAQRDVIADFLNDGSEVVNPFFQLLHFAMLRTNSVL